ncbi:hypothetical protein KKE45_03470 [Patescibacteria group bacterium]|nr:hypothetical protein [Patescibacteria group bacterium]
MSFLLNFLFPPRCYGCKKTGHYICPKCQEKLISQSINPVLSKDLESSLSLFKYNPPLKTAIHDLKYHFVTHLADELVKISIKEMKRNYTNLLKYWQKNNYLLIPLPLHQKRFNWRGFNQSSLLAQKFADKLKLQYSDQILFKTKYTHPQARLKNKILRSSNISNSFSVNTQRHSGLVSGSHDNKSHLPKIILFDDVITTGSTVRSAISILTKHKFKSIWAFSLAG